MEAPSDQGKAAVLVNGAAQPWQAGQTLAQMLCKMGADGPGVAVEHNQRVVPRTEHAVTELQPGDRIEVVRLVGGG